jgi:aminopeptidase N
MWFEADNKFAILNNIFYMRNLAVAAVCFFFISAQAQVHQQQKKDTSWKNNYRGFATKVNDLVNTKLDVRFDFQHSYMPGKAWVTLKPHFYPTDSLQLDAKGMNINSVSIVKAGKNVPLKYTYTDSMFLNIRLDKAYKNNETYTVFIDYVAKTDEYTGTEGSAAIKEAKGLYFINPTGEDKEKPTQIWTQGETEANSMWFPTIDKPNQKSTEEITMTVPSRFVTLSNGKLTSQKKNTDGTRTDTWKMDLPHAPYLFFMGIGEYAVVKDTYKGKEVNYYVEKPYENVAKKIFGLTPEMMGFYSRILGVEYAWPKYSQIVGRDYVSGAMENTTATLHQESAQQNARELVDGNRWEDVIAHELFHHWFGDLVTAESWSNLTVNESFANYSEYLWREYKHGKDAADENSLNETAGYLKGDNPYKNLVRYYYSDKEDMFDAVSYNKGGRILHMLRTYVGDSAFFKSLNLYLTKNRFGTGNADKLRLAFEEVTGKDLNWFFNQWYFGAGHPELEINYNYDASRKIASVYVNQTQPGDKIFRLPIAVDVYAGGAKTRYNVELNHRTDTLNFPVSTKPDLINVDAEKTILAVKKDNKTLNEFIYQYKNAKSFLDRNEALEYAIANIQEPTALQLVKDALNDPYPLLRRKAVGNLYDSVLDKATINKLETIAIKDPSRLVRADAIEVLGSLRDPKFKNLFLQSARDSSYTVAGASLLALLEVDEAAALSLLPELSKDAKGSLEQALKVAEIFTKTDADFNEMYSDFDEATLLDKLNKFNSFIMYLSKVENTTNFKKGMDALVQFRNRLAPFAPGFKEAVNKEFETLKARKLRRKTNSNSSEIDEQVAYINNALAK